MYDLMSGIKIKKNRKIGLEVTVKLRKKAYTFRDRDKGNF